jgi:hypothetical protein
MPDANTLRLEENEAAANDLCVKYAAQCKGQATRRQFWLFCFAALLEELLRVIRRRSFDGAGGGSCMVIASFICHGTPGYWAVRVLARLRSPPH